MKERDRDLIILAKFLDRFCAAEIRRQAAYRRPITRSCRAVFYRHSVVPRVELKFSGLYPRTAGYLRRLAPLMSLFLRVNHNIAFGDSRADNSLQLPFADLRRKVFSRYLVQGGFNKCNDL